MKKKILILAIIAGFAMPINSHAFFFSTMATGMTTVATSMVEGMTETSNNMIDTAGETSVEMLSLMSKLSDDIGIMADRILIMADKIGEMADRIVATEQLMADLVQNLQSNALGNTTSEAPSVILQTPYGSIVQDGQLPEITLSNNAPEYLLYVSPTIIMDSNAISVLIKNPSDLDRFWPMLLDIAEEDHLFIAVKGINNNTISSLSNIIKINLY